MASRCCPRPESIVGWRWKGCGIATCGCCGPRIADDWARAIVAARPDAYVEIPLRDLTFGVTRDRMKRFVSDLRAEAGVLESVWWVEKDEVGDLYVPIITRGSPWDMADFRNLAHARGLNRRVITSFEWCPDDPWAAQAWRESLLDWMLRTPRAGLASPVYRKAKEQVVLHKRLNGRDPAHPSKRFFTSASGDPLSRETALRRTSRWRSGRGWLLECFEAEILVLDEADRRSGRDLVWHDHLWWSEYRLRHHPSDSGVLVGSDDEAVEPPVEGDPDGEDEYWDDEAYAREVVGEATSTSFNQAHDPYRELMKAVRDMFEADERDKRGP